jgi:hypothetical protein
MAERHGAVRRHDRHAPSAQDVVVDASDDRGQ